MPEPSLARARAAIARAERLSRRSGDDSVAKQARRDYAVAKLEDYIRRTVDEAPPLSGEQRDRLALLLRGSEVELIEVGGGPDAA